MITRKILLLKILLREIQKEASREPIVDILTTRKNLTNWTVYFIKVKRQKGSISFLFYRHLLNNLLPRIILYLEEKILHQKAQQWVQQNSVYKKGPQKFFAPYKI